MLMVATAAEIMATEVTLKGLLLLPTNLNPTLSDAQPHKKRRAVAAKQPRGKQLPTVIPEFSEIVVMSLAEAVQRKTKILRFVVSDLQQDVHGARSDADQTNV